MFCVPSFVALRQAVSCTVNTHVHRKFSCKNISLCSPEWIRKKHSQTHPLITCFCLLSVSVVTKKFTICFSLLVVKTNMSHSSELQKDKGRAHCKVLETDRNVHIVFRRKRHWLLGYKRSNGSNVLASQQLESVQKGSFATISGIWSVTLYPE